MKAGIGRSERKDHCSGQRRQNNNPTDRDIISAISTVKQLMSDTKRGPSKAIYAAFSDLERRTRTPIMWSSFAEYSKVWCNRRTVPHVRRWCKLMLWRWWG